jgi:hypothetical protein
MATDTDYRAPQSLIVRRPKGYKFLENLKELLRVSTDQTPHQNNTLLYI